MFFGAGSPFGGGFDDDDDPFGGLIRHAMGGAMRGGMRGGGMRGGPFGGMGGGPFGGMGGSFKVINTPMGQSFVFTSGGPGEHMFRRSNTEGVRRRRQ